MKDLGYRVLPKVSAVSADVIEELRQFPVPDIADTMRHAGTMFGISSVYPSTRRIAGPAVTLSVTVPNIDMLRVALDLCQRGDILVINARGITTQAILGGYMSQALVNRGVAGVIADGVVRDANEMRENGLPVYARGSTTNGAALTAPGEVNVPIACGGTVVHPGDIIVADEGGIVAIPPAAIDTVLMKVRNLITVHEGWAEEVARGEIFGFSDSLDRVKAAGCSFDALNDK